MAFTMRNLIIAYSLLLVVLTAIAIYVQVTSSTLSLPLSTGTTVLTIILPFLAAANVIYMPSLRNLMQQRSASQYALLQQFLPIISQIIQGVLTVVLATLSAQGFTPGRTLQCALEGNWQRMWSAHDGRSIERIQDAFACCGFNGMKDRAWPPNQCPDVYKNRHIICNGPWGAVMQRTAGLEFAVAVTVGILQMIALALFTLRNSADGGARMGYRPIVRGIGSNPHDRLLRNGTANNDDDENTPEVEDNTGNDRQGYGTLDDDGPNHRIEPSGLGDERNNWRE
ncbi:hypothetical protein F5Y04DRAFT_288506 [Hypomontagnella monticulosa]|nr:hypothetical protein F5Y04DRAFT_288506 [Hypomontagnella monticulosa]